MLLKLFVLNNSKARELVRAPLMLNNAFSLHALIVSRLALLTLVSPYKGGNDSNNNNDGNDNVNDLDNL